MDIIVEGNGSKDFKPNQVVLSFTFETKDANYEKALEKGVANVNEYFKVLNGLGFKKGDLKTRSFRVSENRRYDETQKIYINEGFIYTQNATLKFDYDMNKVSELMEVTSKSKNSPRYVINFNLKDNKKVQEEILALAFKDAKAQAEAIAKASGNEIKECLKISFEPFDTRTYSQTTYKGEMLAKSSVGSVRENITNTFIPEDVTIFTKIYCHFTTK